MANHILCEFTIKEEDLKSPIQLLNHDDVEKGKSNETELKESCELYLNGNKIDFTFKYKFEKEGKYKLKIICNKPLSNINYLFYNCSCLNFIDLSHFNTTNLTELNGTFYNCTSLTTILLFNFNSTNIHSMNNLF